MILRNKAREVTLGRKAQGRERERKSEPVHIGREKKLGETKMFRLHRKEPLEEGKLSLWAGKFKAEEGGG